MSDDRAKAAGFTVSTGEPDEIDLELASIGAVPAGAMPPIERAAVGPLRGARESLEAHRAWFLATRPGLPAPAPRRARWPAVAVAALAALAAAALVGVAIAPAPAPEAAEVRVMGGLPVDLQVRRGGRAAPSGSFRAGDDVFLRFTAPAPGRVRVATVQADGAVSVLEPGRQVRAAEVFTLDGAARLDDHRGREWLVVTLEPEGAPPRDFAGLLPDPAAHAGPRTWVLDVTRER